MRALVQKIVLISAYTKDNMLSSVMHIKLGYDLKENSFSFKEAKGCYKGDKECSYMVIVDNEDEQLDILMLLALKYKQESILIRHTDNTCYLLYTDTFNKPEGQIEAEYIGRWIEISSNQSRPNNYTEIDNRYFTTTL